LSVAKSLSKATIMLVDNGSSRVRSTVELRRISSELSKKTGHTIHPVSLQHANRISENDINEHLEGEPAVIFSEFLTKKLEQDLHQFIVIPLFFGNSNALTSFIPTEVDRLEKKYGPIELCVKDVLYSLPQGNPKLIEILYQHALSLVKKEDDIVVLVDHGSPKPTVTAVRNHIATQLQKKLNQTIDQAVMERRSGKEYDFNGELLEHYLERQAEQGVKHISVLLLFMLPGSHAGKDGDISKICQSAKDKYPSLKISVSPLVGQHPMLIECLKERLIN